VVWPYHEKKRRRKIIEWKQEGKRPQGKPRKRWLDVVEEDLKATRVHELEEIVQDRERWRDIVKAAKTLIEL